MAQQLEVVERKSSLPTERPPLLFVHGSAYDAWCWTEHFLDYFAEHGFSAYALSLRGHGGSGGRESFRAILDLSFLRPDPVRVRGTPLLVLGAERDYIIPPPRPRARRMPTAPNRRSWRASRTM